MQLLEAQRAAVFLGVSEARLYDLARQGIVPCVRLGRTVRFDEGTLKEFVAAGGKALPGGWRRDGQTPLLPRSPKARSIR
jgi:excisionase family DNA binding protein